METWSRTFAVSFAAVIAIAFNPVTALSQDASNSALSFNGTNDLVIVPGHPLLELTDGTLELWFKPTAAVLSFAMAVSNRLVGHEVQPCDVITFVVTSTHGS
jgi:hypothetical protein